VYVKVEQDPVNPLDADRLAAALADLEASPHFGFHIGPDYAYFDCRTPHGQPAKLHEIGKTLHALGHPRVAVEEGFAPGMEPSLQELTRIVSSALNRPIPLQGKRKELAGWLLAETEPDDLVVMFGNAVRSGVLTTDESITLLVFVIEAFRNDPAYAALIMVAREHLAGYL
jgi:hypothetical protein